MEILLTIVIALFLTALYVIKNLLKKLEKYEEFVEKETQRNQALLEALREIDNRQMFEKDDEVGSIFYQIKETIEKFKTKQNAN